MKKIMVAIKESEVGSIYSQLLWLLVIASIIYNLFRLSEWEHSGRLIIVVILIITFQITMLFLFVMRIRRAFWFKYSKAGKSLLKYNLAEEFISTIDSELLETSIVEYEHKPYKLRLIITPKWFIYISRNGSVIRKRDDIVKASLEYSTEGGIDHGSVRLLVLSFSDGTQFTTHCGYAYNDIVSTIREAIPDVGNELN